MIMMNLPIKNVVVQSIINRLNNKMRVVVRSIPFGKCRNDVELHSNSNNDFNIIIERRSCWCILFIDNGTRVEAKIIHVGRGKFKILEDNCKERYINRIVDASDVVRCKVEPAAHIYDSLHSRNATSRINYLT
jgi:hypothetical protein